MKTSINSTARTVALIAISAVIITGCGDAPVDDVGANPYLGQETGAQAQPNTDFTYEIPLEETRPSLDGLRIEAPELEAIPEADGHVADHGFDIIEDLVEDVHSEDGVEEDVVDEEVVDQAEVSIEDGFSDGDATKGEWKSIAKETCRHDESELVAMETIGEREEALFRAARFVCEDAGEESEEIFEAKYVGVVMGGESSCKSYDSFQEAAHRVCGSTAEIVTKKVFNSCSASGGDAMFESALFICRIN